MAGKLIAALVNRVRKVFFTEKTTVQVEDLDLEHLLLYHGLVGSSPENQRDYKDVRADIYAALKSSSALQLGMALKLPPLYWEDKLKRIFSDVPADEREAAVATLLPDTNVSDWPTIADPLGHVDWRVRANAAMILGFLEAREGLQRMISSLDDTANSASPAFPHLANALGRLGGEQAKQALIAHLQTTENWLAVDAVAALTNWPLPEVSDALIDAVLSMNPLTDYMAVSIARKIEPLLLLTSDQPLIREGGCQVVIGLIEASKQTFTNDLLGETNIVSCFPQISKLVKENPNPVSLAAASECSKIWADKHEELQGLNSEPDSEKTVTELKQALSDQTNTTLIRACIAAGAQNLPKSTIDLNRLRYAVRLSAELGIAQTEPLLKLLSSSVPFSEDIVQALGASKDGDAVQPLVDLANSIFSVKERAALPKSQQPIAEDNPKKAKLYWQILRALGHFGSQTSIDFLLEACQDYAPDKRQQAMESLALLYKDLSPSQKSTYTAIVGQALDDSATQVRVAALAAVGLLDDGQVVDKLLRLSGSQELSISRQCLKTLEQLHRQGHKNVVPAVRARISSETDQFKRKRLSDFLENIGG
jgi:HEAT repeat protein